MADKESFEVWWPKKDEEGNDGKPTVLVLHGCRQGKLDDLSGSVDVYSYARTLHKKLRTKYGTLYALAPHTFYDEETGCERGRHWFEKQLKIEDIPGGIDFDEELMMPTLDMLHETISKFNVSVLVGFSQGANVIDTYLAHHPAPHPITSVVLFSGYGFKCDDRRTVDVPCLLVGCPEDNIVPWPTQFVSYENTKAITHIGRPLKPHSLPKSAKVYTKVAAFIKDHQGV